MVPTVEITSQGNVVAFNLGISYWHTSIPKVQS